MLLATAIYEVGKKAGEVFEGTATGGGATTLIDTNQVSTVDDFYNGGTMCFLSGTGLINTTRVITDYADTTRTFTFATGTAISAGIRYAAIRPALNRAMIVGAINAALAEIGNITQHDDTLEVTDDTQEYTLPDGVRNVARVQVATSDTAPYDWKDTYTWRENAGSLIFEPDTEPDDEGMLMRIYYNQPHAEVTLDADEISTDIHPARLAWAAAAHALGQTLRNTRNEGANKDAFTLAQQKAAEMAARYPVRPMPRTPTYSTFLK